MLASAKELLRSADDDEYTRTSKPAPKRTGSRRCTFLLAIRTASRSTVLMGFAILIAVFACFWLAVAWGAAGADSAGSRTSLFHKVFAGAGRRGVPDPFGHPLRSLCRGRHEQTIERLASSPIEDAESVLSALGNHQLAPDGADANFALSSLSSGRGEKFRGKVRRRADDRRFPDLPEKYRAVRGDGSGREEFAIKTISFVNYEIEQAFPGIPAYAALGEQRFDRRRLWRSGRRRFCKQWPSSGR